MDRKELKSKLDLLKVNPIAQNTEGVFHKSEYFL